MIINSVALAIFVRAFVRQVEYRIAFRQTCTCSYLLFDPSKTLYSALSDNPAILRTLKCLICIREAMRVLFRKRSGSRPPLATTVSPVVGGKHI